MLATSAPLGACAPRARPFSRAPAAAARRAPAGPPGRAHGAARANSAGRDAQRACAGCSSSGSGSSEGSSGRREALLAAAGALLAPSAAAVLQQLASAVPAAAADAPEGFKLLYDPILAYQFVYPVVAASGEQLQLTLTHPPEKYSSAAPLSADARQRIVSELFDLKRFVTVSMTVGPASGVLRGLAQEAWKPREVALTVLVDRSTARLSSGQRTALNDVEEAHAEERGGQTYYVYEHTSQGSPTISSTRSETYRHALAVTTTRPGLDGKPYLYTLNLSCPQALWDDLSGGFKAAVDSFMLVDTTDAYIPPDKDPWLFF